MKIKHVFDSIFVTIVAAIAFAACGVDSEPNVEYRDRQTDAAFDTVKPLVAAKCGVCHNGSTHPLRFDTGAVFKGSKAATRIKNGTMPPSGPLGADDKAALLAYLEG